MPGATGITKRPIITLIIRSDCGTCQALLADLQPMQDEAAHTFRIIDPQHEELPEFAQGYIFPATYINNKLWRFGKFQLGDLEERLARENTILPKRISID